MTSHVGGMHPPAARGRETTTGMGAMAGWTAAAAILLFFGGIMAIMEGIAAISKDAVFVTTADYTFSWSLTGWGWTHLILGIVVALAGLALFTGATWARVVGVVLAGLSMFANFLWIPYAPVWSIALIVIDGFIIWALCAPSGARTRA
jgi:hypothetical protein